MQSLAIFFALLITGNIAYGYYQDYFEFKTVQHIEGDVLTVKAKNGRMIQFDLGDEREGVFYAFANQDMDGTAKNYGIQKHLGTLTVELYEDFKLLFNENKKCRADFLNTNTVTYALYAENEEIANQLHNLEYDGWESGPYYIKGRSIRFKEGVSKDGGRLGGMQFRGGNWDQWMVTEIKLLNEEELLAMASSQNARAF